MMDNAGVSEKYLGPNTNCSVYSQFCEFDRYTRVMGMG